MAASTPPVPDYWTQHMPLLVEQRKEMPGARESRAAGIANDAHSAAFIVVSACAARAGWHRSTMGCKARRSVCRRRAPRRN